MGGPLLKFSLVRPSLSEAPWNSRGPPEVARGEQLLTLKYETIDINHVLATSKGDSFH